MENVIKASINLIQNYLNHHGGQTAENSQSLRRWGLSAFPITAGNG